MHPNNLHREGYNFDALVKNHAPLKAHLFQNNFGNISIDFASSEAVMALNKALLIHHYNITDWNLPAGYLCPPIPGRADYVHHLADLVKTKYPSRG